MAAKKREFYATLNTHFTEFISVAQNEKPKQTVSIYLIESCALHPRRLD